MIKENIVESNLQAKVDYIQPLKIECALDGRFSTIFIPVRLWLGFRIYKYERFINLVFLCYKQSCGGAQ
jgi:hypothetical protein